MQREQTKQAEQEAAAAREEQRHTEECAAELSYVVAACAKGDFSQRLSLDNKEGVLAEISVGLNRISEGVQTSLEEFRRALSQMSEGDLTYSIDGKYEGIFGEIAASLTETIHTMAGTISNVMHASDTVSSSAREISVTTNDLTKRSEENAEMLRKTANSIGWAPWWWAL